jgi:hypothetical protein
MALFADSLLGDLAAFFTAIAALIGAIIAACKYLDERKKRVAAEKRAFDERGKRKEAEMREATVEEQNADLEIEIADLRKREESGFTPTVSRYHDALANAMRPYKGQELTTAKIKEYIRQSSELQDVEQWVLPSDHCQNHTCKGACRCATSDRAIFVKVRRGAYLVR